MSTFSSVVRKPGQKLVPKTAPRRTVQRTVNRSSLPPLTPESQPASQNVDSTAGQTERSDLVSEEQSVSQAVDSVLLPVDAPNLSARPTSEAQSEPSDGAHPPPIVVVAPVAKGGGAAPPVLAKASARSIIPKISTSTSALPRRDTRSTVEETPARSGSSTQDRPPAVVPTGSDSRKRAKTAQPNAHSIEVRLRATKSPIESAQLLLRSSPRQRRSESRTSDALLQDATSQAAAVSELANSIEIRARSLRPRPVRDPSYQASEPEDQSGPHEASSRANRHRRKRRKIQDIESAAQQAIDHASAGNTPKQGKSRLSTPDDAEEVQINPEEVSMGDLVKNNKSGRKSETERKMQEHWQEIKRRRKEETERRREAADRGRHGRQNGILTQPGPLDLPLAPVPQQIIVNGQIVVVAESREVAFGSGVEQAVIEDAAVALEDDRIYKYINQNTVGRKAGQRRPTRWDDDQTELFYKGLRMFGTDFSMIANLFPWSDRKQVKLKFIAEHRAHPSRVQSCVAAKEAITLDEYSKMANLEFDDPDALQADLDAEERRLRDEDERRRANEGYVVEAADIALPTTERDGSEMGDVAARAIETTAAPGVSRRGEHMSALAESIVASVAAPKRKAAQQQRRTKEPTAGRGRQAKKGRRPLEGVEEQIGPIDEVER